MSFPHSEAIKAQLAAELRARTTWDEPPALFTLHVAEDGVVRMVQMPVPLFVWEHYGHPPTAVAAVAAMAAELSGLADGQHVLVWSGQPLIGVALRYEGYALNSESPSPQVQETIRRREVGGSVPRFKHVPGRLEQRCISAQDTAGGRYWASCNRTDPDKPDATDPQAHYAPPGDTGTTMQGNVAESVARLLAAVRPAATAPGGTFGR